VEPLLISKGGSGLNILGSGRARVLAIGLGHFGAIKIKIGLEALKIWALKMGLKICSN
jgi:hypothetical protein